MKGSRGEAERQEGLGGGFGEFEELVMTISKLILKSVLIHIYRVG